jgi:hypothetical protein
MRAFMTVYVDRAASEDAVRAATTVVPRPAGVEGVHVDRRASAEVFDCRVAVELTGTFDSQDDACDAARRYAAQLSGALDVPAYALCDLLRPIHDYAN